MSDISKIPLESLPTELIQNFVAAAKIELSKRRRNGKIEKRRKFIKSKKKRLGEYSVEMEAVKKHNSENLLSIRGIKTDPINSRARYLGYLLAQDWSKLFPYDACDGEYYVYCHVDPHGSIFTMGKKCGGNYGGMPFYIGKGIGNRAYDLKRNQGHGKMIKKALDEGWQPDDIVHIAFSGLSEKKALEIESKLIYFFGTVYEKDRHHTTLYNLDIPKRPKFGGIMKKIPFRSQCSDSKEAK